MGGKEAKLSCQLTTPELRQRKVTVIAGVKNLVFDKPEYAMGSDSDLTDQIQCSSC